MDNNELIKAAEEYVNYYKEIEDQFDFIWGLKASDDFSPGNEANMHTMNDIDIIYDKNTNKYSIGIETIYMFDDESEGAKRYMKRLLNSFTDWMQENNLNTEVNLALYEVFTSGFNINTEFDDIETLYSTFKFLVNGFINQ